MTHFAVAGLQLELSAQDNLHLVRGELERLKQRFPWVDMSVLAELSLFGPHVGNAGTVEKIEKFGVFVILEPGLTGLLPGSEMGLPRGANVGRVYSVGKQVKVQVAHIDVKRKRVSLTLEGKTLEGSRSDYQAYVKQTRKSTGLGALAAALGKIRPQS